MLQLITILMSLSMGYLCNRLPLNSLILNKFLNLAVLLILLIMGYEFGFDSSHIGQQLISLFEIILVCIVTLLILNCFSIYLLIKFTKFNKYELSRHLKVSPKFNIYLLENSKYIGFILIGVFLGYTIKINLLYAENIISIMLLIILFIVGYQLRQQGISLKNILINQMGIKIAALILFSSLISGVLVSLFLGVSLRVGLMLCSGFGWYTLSGILTGHLINHQMGMVSFFIDFIREIIAIVLIPAIGRTNPYIIIGYCGATALDFTLPIIKVNLGNEFLPVAISSGMILTIIVPILIPLLNSLPF